MEYKYRTVILNNNHVHSDDLSVCLSCTNEEIEYLQVRHRTLFKQMILPI